MELPFSRLLKTCAADLVDDIWRNLLGKVWVVLVERMLWWCCTNHPVVSTIIKSSISENHHSFNTYHVLLWVVLNVSWKNINPMVGWRLMIDDSTFKPGTSGDGEYYLHPSPTVLKYYIIVRKKRTRCVHVIKKKVPFITHMEGLLQLSIIRIVHLRGNTSFIFGWYCWWQSNLKHIETPNGSAARLRQNSFYFPAFSANLRVLSETTCVHSCSRQRRLRYGRSKQWI